MRCSNWVALVLHYVWEHGCGCGCVSKNFEIFFFTKIEYGLYVLDRFDVLMSKIIFKKYKNIIGMYFSTKSYLKSTRNYTIKHAISISGTRVGALGQPNTQASSPSVRYPRPEKMCIQPGAWIIKIQIIIIITSNESL